MDIYVMSLSHLDSPISDSQIVLQEGTPEMPNTKCTKIRTGGTWSCLGWSNDDSHLLVKKYISATESYLYVLSLVTAQLVPINPINEKISYGEAIWSKNSNGMSIYLFHGNIADKRSTGIFLTTDYNNEFKQLKYWDLDQNRFTKELS